ncbi:hypothetical protein B0T22DRAFT_479329 [Podospora appendiculata]|uniref:Uncharacterized protein n=1 Tax=Podospora appendiculata TaxID=314037 RepID=A0AAE0X8J2_9PEZI|nr:hypothetical protein B0T22DRAFT_479329 [Podospora appendiculata]
MALQYTYNNTYNGASDGTGVRQDPRTDQPEIKSTKKFSKVTPSPGRASMSVSFRKRVFVIRFFNFPPDDLEALLGLIGDVWPHGTEGKPKGDAYRVFLGLRSNFKLDTHQDTLFHFVKLQYEIAKKLCERGWVFRCIVPTSSGPHASVVIDDNYDEFVSTTRDRGAYRYSMIFEHDPSPQAPCEWISLSMHRVGRLTLVGDMPLALRTAIVNCFSPMRYDSCDGKPWSLFHYLRHRQEMGPKGSEPSCTLKLIDIMEEFGFSVYIGAPECPMSIIFKRPEGWTPEARGSQDGASGKESSGVCVSERGMNGT